MILTIDSLTHHGMGRAGDGTLHARTLPGEVVELLPDGALRVLSPSPDRVAPACRHFRSCGGCAMQHLRDDRVAAWKAEIVAAALKAQGLAVPVAGVLTSPPQSRRRAGLAGRRTKGGAIVGFHARGSDTIVPVPDCRLLSPALMAGMPAYEALIRLAASRSGEVGLTVTETLAGLDILLQTSRDLTPALRTDLAALAERHGIARIVWRDDPVVQRHPPVIRLGAARVVPPPGAFLQATAEGEAALVALVREGVDGARRIVDLFAGCGTFALPLAEGAEVHAVEGDDAMRAALDRGWRGTPGLKRITTEARDLFRRPLLPDELAGFDAAVVDPPRAGALAQVTEIARSPLNRVVMVACHPATFARDVRVLVSAGFVPGPVTVVDQFRWSPHVELCATLTRP
jgi:23S rRNA (uracil1939-C5)-methyltransferase